MNSIPPNRYVYLIGKDISHSVSPVVHDFVISYLGPKCPFQFLPADCESISEVEALLKQPSFAGAVITMPYKKSIMPFVDHLDDLAIKLGACNNIYRTADGSWRGTNTDWIGISGCLVAASPSHKDRADGRPGLVIGAGGAAKAAVYALHRSLGCRTVYIANRDFSEIQTLLADMSPDHHPDLTLVHVQTTLDAAGLETPAYIVSTVPDFEPTTPYERLATNILETFLSHAREKGVMLDMCYRPRWTRNLQRAERHGWKVIQGQDVVGYQVPEQYRLWCGANEKAEQVARSIPMDDVWKVLGKAVEQSLVLNDYGPQL